MKEEENWDLVLKPKTGWFSFDLRSLWEYRDLVFLFVKRDLVVSYKQTILGPIWFFMQPIMSTLIFMVIFSKVARLSTDGISPFLFYLSGTTLWSFFSTSITGTSNTFVANAPLFGKVYFPRITVPVSVVLSNAVRFLIQLAGFLVFYFILSSPQNTGNIMVLFLPLVLLQMSILSLGFGLLVSGLVTKYRDLSLLMTFFVQLWMYATPIIYPFSQVPEKYHALYLINPMTVVLEFTRYAFFNVGLLRPDYIALSWAETILILLIGLLVFNKVERTAMDLA